MSALRVRAVVPTVKPRSGYTWPELIFSLFFFAVCTFALSGGCKLLRPQDQPDIATEPTTERHP
jgi:hypothetical protein